MTSKVLRRVPSNDPRGHVELAATQREGGRIRAKDRVIHFAEQAPERRLVRRPAHDDAGTVLGRKPAVVAEVAVERHDRASELERAPKMLDVAGAAEVVV